jgi:hypothetical protein
MIEERNEILSQIFERYEQINGRKILDALKKFEFRENEKTFEKACLMGAVEYLEKRVGEMTDEELLALLVRLCMMHFVQEGHRKNLWFLIMSGLLPKEIQEAKMSEVVRKFEEQFIEYMEMIGSLRGDEGVRDAVLFFLFKENSEFVFLVLQTTNMMLENISKMLH